MTRPEKDCSTVSYKKGKLHECGGGHLSAHDDGVCFTPEQAVMLLADSTRRHSGRRQVLGFNRNCRNKCVSDPPLKCVE